SEDKKSYDLVWILHLVGDVHQPLHCATRVDATHPDGDAGGNRVKLDCKGCNSELHAFWDGALGTAKSPQAALSPVTKSAKKLPAASTTAAAITKEDTWATESFTLAKSTAYSSGLTVEDEDTFTFTLTTAYKTTAKKVAKDQVALAGAR